MNISRKIETTTLGLEHPRRKGRCAFISISNVTVLCLADEVFAVGFFSCIHLTEGEQKNMQVIESFWGEVTTKPNTGYFQFLVYINGRSFGLK